MFPLPCYSEHRHALQLSELSFIIILEDARKGIHITLDSNELEAGMVWLCEQDVELQGMNFPVA